MTDKKAIDNQRHHYVPQFYLKYWGIPKKGRQIWAHDIRDGKTYLTGVKNVAQERGFYKVPGEASLETELAKIESQVSPTWKKLAKIKSITELSEEEKINIALFVCTGTARNIEMREEIRDISRLTLQHLEKSNGGVGENLSSQLNMSQESATKVMVSLVRHHEAFVPIILSNYLKTRNRHQRRYQIRERANCNNAR
jgi:hypothetical protein